jgi:hypothetical protein
MKNVREEDRDENGTHEEIDQNEINCVMFLYYLISSNHALFMLLT